MNRYLSIALLATALLASPAHALIKKSKSGICHDESSQYFVKTKNFTPYQSLDACLDSGGRLPKGQSAKQQSSRQSSVNTGYSRDKFGKGWADVDHDGQDTKQEILIAQNTGNLTFNDKGRVVRGRWISMYSGKVIVNASEVDIDHIVPLSWAWKHGADKWSQEKREQFANDPRNLVAVEASLNRQKGDKGPDEWMPKQNIKQYQIRFSRITKHYQLNYK